MLTGEFKNKKSAIIVLHEIYGINKFIQKQCQKFEDMGYDVLCPNLLDKEHFSYEESAEAYDYFIKKVGFEAYKVINDLVNRLKEKYENVFIIGYSVGATIAWRCCENPFCSGIVACYGSRIRDYTDLNPVCPTLLLFADRDSFDVDMLLRQFHNRRNLTIIKMDAAHGFIDNYSKYYDIQKSKIAEESIRLFLETSGK